MSLHQEKRGGGGKIKLCSEGDGREFIEKGGKKRMTGPEHTHHVKEKRGRRGIKVRGTIALEALFQYVLEGGKGRLSEKKRALSDASLYHKGKGREKLRKEMKGG